MVIKNPDASEYIEPLKKLFPKGEYWDRLLSDPASDVSLVCAARAESLAAFKMRMNQLLRESSPDFADETIGDWERIYFGYENGGLELGQRRSLLRIQRYGGINIGVLKTIAETYGGSVSKWEIPDTHGSDSLIYLRLRECGWYSSTHLFPKKTRAALRLPSGGQCSQTKQSFLYMEIRIWQECSQQTKKSVFSARK